MAGKPILTHEHSFINLSLLLGESCYEFHVNLMENLVWKNNQYRSANSERNRHQNRGTMLIKTKRLDTERKTLSVTLEKGSNPRILPISDNLLRMLNSLSKQHKPYLFQPRKNMLKEYFCTQRNAIAERLKNPRLKQITFHTFRH
jgi:integrase